MSIVQDTTDATYSSHKSAKLASSQAKALLIHSALAVAGGVPLGLTSQEFWTRAPEERGKSSQRKDLPPEEKESHKWVKGLHQTIENLPEGTTAIFVCDREADVYDFMREVLQTGHYFLIRAVQNRRVDECTHLHELVRSQPVAGRCLVDVPRDPSRNLPPRQAGLEVRFSRGFLPSTATRACLSSNSTRRWRRK